MRNSVLQTAGLVQNYAPNLRAGGGTVRRMNLLNAFTAHPRSVGETYTQHMGVASRCGLSMIMAGFACLVHALLPFLFERTASNCLTRLYQSMVTQRARQAATPAAVIGLPTPR